MVQVENLKEVLSSIGFVRAAAGECFTRDYGTCSVAVDFDSQKISYPEEKGLRINDRTTSNFEHPENFVVLECVCRLLEKGYRPEHIELEPKWTVGHDAKGGKADILVRNVDGQPLLIIECKTWGLNSARKRKEQSRMATNCLATSSKKTPPNGSRYTLRNGMGVRYGINAPSYIARTTRTLPNSRRRKVALKHTQMQGTAGNALRFGTKPTRSSGSTT